MPRALSIWDFTSYYFVGVAYLGVVKVLECIVR